MPAIDFSEVEDLKPVDPGVYMCEVLKATVGESQSGYDKIDVQLQIINGDNEGRILFDTISFHPKALPFTKRKLIALGFDSDFSGEVDPDDIVGGVVAVTASIDHNEDNINPDTGEPYPPRNRVTKYQPSTTTIEDLV